MNSGSLFLDYLTGPASASARPDTDQIAAATRYTVARREAEERDFLAAHPDFDPAGTFASMRRREYGRLDATGHVYLDYTGGGLHAASQVDAHAQLLREHVLGNPHSHNPTSRASTELVEHTRQTVLDYFNAPEDEYLCIFTANASAALKLVGESYGFEPGGTFALTFDNHNSVNGIREFAARRGGNVVYVPVRAPDLRIDHDAMRRVLQSADPTRKNLLAFPAQSNFSGVQHRLDLVAEAQACGWDVLVDTAAFAPTNRLDLAQVRPDFACISFYKMMGYPTGAGCLLVRREAANALTRPWFAGGTVTIASVQGRGHYLQDSEAGFEDGTVDYTNLPAVDIGLRHLSGLGIDRIHARVTALTGWLLDAFAGLRHANGRPVVEVLGPCDNVERGGTVAFQVLDRNGRAVPLHTVEELAGRANISLRTGCFCNPGAGEVAHHLGARELAEWFRRDEVVTFDALRDGLLRDHDAQVGAVRISLGSASSFGDVYRFLCFAESFVDHAVHEIERTRARTIDLRSDR